jgi:Transposase zinc-ribbon domain
MEDANTLVAGITYLQTLRGVDNFFPDNNACRKYLAGFRWPHACQCPACDSLKAPLITARGYPHRQECSTETAITSGTIFLENSLSSKEMIFRNPAGYKSEFHILNSDQLYKYVEGITQWGVLNEIKINIRRA